MSPVGQLALLMLASWPQDRQGNDQCLHEHLALDAGCGQAGPPRAVLIRPYKQ